MVEANSRRCAAALGNAIPIFHVSDLAASIAYYTDVLGFTIDWTDPGGIASVSRDRCTIFLCQGDQGFPGAWTWIGVADVEILHAEWKEMGATVRHPPTNYNWACEMQIHDLDGNVLRVGSATKPGEPFGAWLDMHGDSWIQSSTGEWSRVDK